MPALLLWAGSASPAEAQTVRAWPFDIQSEDMLRVDLAAVEWAGVRMFVGGATGSVRYRSDDPSEGECRAVGLITSTRLRARFVQQREVEPVTIGVDFTCGDAFRGTVRYDGVNTFMEMRDAATREMVFQGRRRGPPTLDQ